MADTLYLKKKLLLSDKIHQSGEPKAGVCYRKACQTPAFSGNVFPQGLHVAFESVDSGLRDFAGGAGHLAFEALLDGDVARRAKLVNLHAEVARGRAGLFLEIAEIRLAHFGQYGHHRQSQLRMEERV